MSRSGSAYGSNRSESGLYAAAAFEEEAEHLDTGGTGEGFKVDGSTGATYFLNVSINHGQTIGELPDGGYPAFSADREIIFDPLYDQTLVDAFSDLLPFAIEIGSAEALFVLSPSYDGVSGFPFSTFAGGTPPSGSPENELEYGDINVAEIVSAEDGVIRMIAMSMSGYVVDITLDLSGDAPVLSADWMHLHEGTRGTSSSFYSNYGPL